MDHRFEWDGLPGFASEDEARAWDLRFSQSWKMIERPWPPGYAFMDRWEHHGNEMDMFVQDTVRLHCETGIILRDWSHENMGRTADGRVVLCDMSMCSVPEEMHEYLKMGMASLPQEPSVHP